MERFSATISLIQKGHERLREELIASQKEFIRSFASFVCRKKLDWHNDDELSIALIAFNRAIDTYNPEAGSSFLTYARLLIRNSLVDYFRKTHSPPGTGGGALGEGLSPRVEEKVSVEQHALYLDNLERASEIVVFQELLARYGLSLDALVKSSPRHRDTRAKLKELALLLARDENLRERIYREKRLPLLEIEAAYGIRRKVLEKWRKYLLSLILIATHGELELLCEYIWGRSCQKRDGQNKGPRA